MSAQSFRPLTIHERVAVTETTVKQHGETIDELKKDVKSIQRTIWFACGAVGLLEVFVGILVEILR